jgi:hypothetical protein
MMWDVWKDRVWEGVMSGRGGRRTECESTVVREGRMDRVREHESTRSRREDGQGVGEVDG